MATIYGGEGRALPQRALLVSLQTLILGAALWLLEGGGDAVVAGWTGWSLEGGDPTRRALLSATMILLYLRMSGTVLVLVKRAIPWSEAFSIPFAFGVYYLGFALLGAGNAAPAGAGAWLGLAIYLLGSVLNTGSELLRAQWKKRPENKGKCYTGGLFRYAVHINYTGDVLWAAGFAAIAGNAWGWIIPGALFCFFKFFNAPMLDRHLSEHYGAEFDSYKAKTASMIPFLW